YYVVEGEGSFTIGQETRLLRSGEITCAFSDELHGAIHVLGLGTEQILASAVVVLPPIFILGVLLAWITIRSGRLGPALFIPSGWNLLAALVLLLPPEVLEAAS
ncbi:MAG: hypothetical protein O7D28_04345, partial [Actinobacteria bacterium]|nr:hypothetical protein [Actinomycetota bacterium]